MPVDSQAWGFLKGPVILQRMGGEVGDAPEDPELLRRKEEFKGIILFGWNDKDFHFFFLHFKVKKKKF